MILAFTYFPCPSLILVAPQVGAGLSMELAQISFLTDLKLMAAPTSFSLMQQMSVRQGKNVF